jgi:hypothetical protein
LIYHWNFPKGKYMIFQGRCKNSQEVQNDLMGGAHLPSKSGHGYNYLKIQAELQRYFSGKVFVSQIFTLIYHWNFPKGAWLFRGGAKILRGGAKQSQGRCAPPLKIWPWLQLLEKYKQNFNGIFQAVVSLSIRRFQICFPPGFFGGRGAHVLEPNNSKSGLSSPMIACTVGGFMGGWATSLRGWA